MDLLLIAIISSGFLLYSLVSGRLQSTVITALLTPTVITVALSILLHGVTAAPFARLYGNLTSRMGECEENQPVVELPLREGFIKTEITESNDP